MSIFAIERPREIATFEILSDGDITPSQYTLEYIDVRHTANKVSSAEFALIDGDSATQDFGLSADDAFAIGKTIDIKVGFNSDNQPVFKGLIIAQRITVTPRGHTRLIVSCKHIAVRMTQAPHVQIWEETSPEDILKQLCDTHAIDFDSQLNNALPINEQVVQCRQSDWDFSVLYAYRFGKFLLAEEDRLVLREASISKAQLTAEFGTNIIEADLSLDASHISAEVEQIAWNEQEQQTAQGESSSASLSSSNQSVTELADAMGGQTLTQISDAYASEEALLEGAKAQHQLLADQALIGTIKIDGQTDIHVGDTITLKGFGDRFNGDVLVGGVLHALEKGNFTTTVQIGFAQAWFTEQNKQSVDTGLHIAKVVQLADDPQDNARIKVSLVLADDNQGAIWARLASQDAGAERGAFFIPHIDDEVVVSFLDGDPSQPIVLGALYSAANEPSENLSDDNFVRGWTTASGLKVRLHDDEKSIELSSQAGNTFHISEQEEHIKLEDQHGNTLVLSSQGINIESASNITMKAAQNLNIEGTNINIKAQANAELAGGAGLNLNSDALTIVKGSLVQIN